LLKRASTECVFPFRAVAFCRAMERKSPDATLHVRLEQELRSQLEELARAEDRPLVAGPAHTWFRPAPP
jgi:hypothetical protein